MACCMVTLNDVVSLKLLKSKHIYNFYRIKEEEEENHRNKKEITTKFDEEPKYDRYVLNKSFVIYNALIMRSMWNVIA